MKKRGNEAGFAQKGDASRRLRLILHREKQKGKKGHTGGKVDFMSRRQQGGANATEYKNDS